MKRNYNKPDSRLLRITNTLMAGSALSKSSESTDGHVTSGDAKRMSFNSVWDSEEEQEEENN